MNKTQETQYYRKALILAGGSGTRMRRLGEVLPKCLVPIYDQPILIRQVEQCVLAGANKIYVSVAKKFAPLVHKVCEMYEQQEAQRHDPRRAEPITLTCIPEERPLGPVAGLLACADYVEDSSSLVLLGDEYYESNAPFEALSKGIRPSPIVMGALITRDPHRIHCNIIHDAQGHVSMIREKPKPEQIKGQTRWCGFVALHAGVLSQARRLPTAELQTCTHTGDIYERLRAKGVPVEILWFPEYHLNVNSPNDAMAAGLLDMRKNWARVCPDAVPNLNQTIAAVFRAMNISYEE